MSVAAAEASSGTLRDQTYVPDAVDELAPVLSLLEKCDPEARYFLAGTREGERIELPEHVQAVLVQVVRAMAAG